MNIDTIVNGAFLAFFLLFTAAFLLQRLRWRRKKAANPNHRGFYPSALALALTLLSLQTPRPARPSQRPRTAPIRSRRRRRKWRSRRPRRPSQSPTQTYPKRPPNRHPRSPSWQTRLSLPEVFLSFSAQKSHVKPQNHLTRCMAITSEWHFSLVPPAILDIDRKRVMNSSLKRRS
jgi:hypothetical protein